MFLSFQTLNQGLAVVSKLLHLPSHLDTSTQEKPCKLRGDMHATICIF